MYKIIKIGGNDYKFEYTIEASLDNNFVDRITKFAMDYATTIALLDMQGKDIKTEKDLQNMSVSAISSMVTLQTTQAPALALEGFRAGLLEYHKLSAEESKELYKQYLKEYNKTPIDVLSEVFEKVKEDNFFQLIGLDMKNLNINPQQKKIIKPTSNKSKK